jgi:hypothetical protein
MAQGNVGQVGRRNYTSRAKTYTQQAAKDRFVELMQNGMNIGPALEKVGRTRKTYEEWRRMDASFKAKVDQARQLRTIDKTAVRGEKLGFAEFRKKYLKTETFWHQLQWIDVLEGREPRDLHEAQLYTQGKRNRVIVNVPPFHAKSMTITIDYSVYRLCMDPSFRILIVSAGSLLASDFLYGIKQRLTSPDFIELQKAYAPEGGWEATAESWTDSRIIFGTETRSSGEKTTHEKDPNVQTVGMRSKIYGKRADLIVLDDAVDGTNVSEYGKQMTWLRREVSSRLEAGGKLLVVGTRIASVDLYSELMKPENYANGKSPWTYFASPAILEEGETPADHKTLWPFSDQPWVQPGEDADECLCENPACSDGFELDGQRMFARWDGVHLEMGPRAENNNAEWALVYQQKSVPEDATFPEHAVTRAGQPLRLAGVLQADQAGHPYTGMHGKYVIAGLDPSIKGFAGMIVVAVDRETNKRHVMNAWNLRAPTKDQLVEKMKQVTEHYSVNEWRVEKTGLLQFFTQDSVMRQWFSTRGVRFTEHFTGANKWDAAFGVSSLAALFGEYDKSWDTPNAEWREINAPLIELPRPNNDGIKALVHQLITWTPDLDPNKVPCDMVMALWFAEIGAREHLGYGRGAGSLTVFGRSNKFVSPRAGANRQTVRLADYQR